MCDELEAKSCCMGAWVNAPRIIFFQLTRHPVPKEVGMGQSPCPTLVMKKRRPAPKKLRR